MARITPEMPQRGASRNLIQVIDNYYRPARDRMGEAAMAQGFSDVSNFFGNEAAKAKKQQLDEIAKQGAADAMAGLDPNEELAQVRKGLLFRSNSQAYNQAYNETMGKKAAIEFKEKATLDYEKSGMKYDTNPNRFREWMNERVHNFLTDPEHNNPYFLAGAMGYVENATFNLGAAHQANISAQMERNHLAAIQKQADDVALGVSTGEVSLEEGIAKLAGLNNQAYGTGFSGPKSRSALLASWLSVADATDNLEMINALTAAQESGVLRLTPQEWNTITKEGQGIERDIQFRQDQKDRAAKAQAKAEENSVTDIVADFYNNPANAAVPFETFLQAPVGDTGQTMRDIINASPNTDSLMKKAKDAYTTINSVYDIPQSQESMNNLALDAAFENNEIQSSAQLMDWFKAAQADGLRFNDNNWKHAEELMRKFNDPEEPHSTQTYKDYKQTTVNRIIKALTPDDTDLTTSFDGKYQGGMSDDVRLRFQGYLDNALSALPQDKQTDPKLIREAIKLAEELTMDHYKDKEPLLFQKQFKSYVQAANEGEVGFFSNPYFAREAERLRLEQEAIITERTLNLEANRSSETVPFSRPDLDIQRGNAILDGNDGAMKVEVDESVQMKPDPSQEFAKMMVDANAFIQNINSATLNEQAIPVIAQELYDKFNIIVPKTAQEYQYFKDDIAALQEESGIDISPEVMREIEAYFDKLFAN